MSQDSSLDKAPEPATTQTLRADVSLFAVALTAVAFFVGLGIHLRDGKYDATGRIYSAPIFAIGVALLAMLFGVFGPRLIRRRHTSTDLPLLVLLLALIGQFALLIYGPPSGWNTWSDDLRWTSTENRRWYYGGITASATVLLLLVLLRQRLWFIPFVVLLGLNAGLGIWMVRSCPTPDIDVWYFQQIGGQTLLSGDTPYRWQSADGAMRYPNIYAAREDKTTAVYGQKQVGNDYFLRTGFPYTPLSLYITMAGYKLGGDYRYAQVFCLTLAGLLIALARPGGWSALAAVLLIFTPRVFFVIGRGWSEPIVVFFLALTVFTACRLPKLLPIALGLFLASKQYLVFAVPLAWLLVENPRDMRAAGRLIGGALLTAAVVTLPLALWDIKAFWESAFITQLEAPFRGDALSWLAWRYNVFGKQTGSWVAFAVAMPMLLAALKWCPRTPAGFCSGLVAVYLPFVAFNKQAFANYYLFIIAAAVCGIGATVIRFSPPAKPS